jgi:hypothetical protein
VHCAAEQHAKPKLEPVQLPLQHAGPAKLHVLLSGVHCAAASVAIMLMSLAAPPSITATQLCPTCSYPVLHVTLHAPLAQCAVPNMGAAHTLVLDAYEQLPLAHVPDAAYVRTVVPFAQTVAGGWPQVTPAHGSLLHAPLLQPCAHVISVAS